VFPVPDNRRQPSLLPRCTSRTRIPRSVIHLADICIYMIWTPDGMCAQHEAGWSFASLYLLHSCALLPRDDIGARCQPSAFCVSCICILTKESRTLTNQVIHGNSTFPRAIRLEHKSTRAADSQGKAAVSHDARWPTPVIFLSHNDIR
jgi:hypothetical protein